MKRTAPAPQPTQAILYTRVSTQEQAQFGVSLDAQEARLRAYCQMAGLEVVGVIREEGVSGSKALSTRPGGKELMAHLQAGVVNLVALKLDRLFRDAADCLQQTKTWDRAGVSLHLVDFGGTTINTGSAMGRMFLTMTAAFAELERNLISERTKQAMAYMIAQGAQFGGSTGLSDTPDGIAALRHAQELREQGLTLQAIADRLNTEGVKTLRGGSWHPTTVKNLLARAEEVA